LAGGASRFRVATILDGVAQVFSRMVFTLASCSATIERAPALGKA
jgi:hypothetical protein